MSPKADIQDERDVYIRIGRLLLALLNDYDSDWTEAVLHVDNVRLEGMPRAYRLRLTASTRRRLNEALLPPEQLMQLSQELDDLCFHQSGKRWSSYDFRLYQSQNGTNFECHYSYADSMH